MIRHHSVRAHAERETTLSRDRPICIHLQANVPFLSPLFLSRSDRREKAVLCSSSNNEAKLALGPAVKNGDDGLCLGGSIFYALSEGGLLPPLLVHA